MITQKEVSQAQSNLEKLGFSPMAILKGAGKFLAGGVKAGAKSEGKKGFGTRIADGARYVGNKIGDAGGMIGAARKSPGEGLIGTTLTGAAAVGLGAAALSPLTGGLSEKVVGAVPIAGAATKFLNPYGTVSASGRAGASGRYSHLDEMAKRRGSKGKGYNENKSFNKYLVNSKNFNKTSGVNMYTYEDIKRYNKIKSKLEKTAAVSGLRRAVQGAKSGNGDFARQALAYMAGATALGIGAPIIANSLGEGMNFARRGRLNRDYNAMLKQDPELKREPQAKQYFELLHRSSPYVAQEPVIAATVVRNLVDSPALDGRKFKDILDIEKARQETKNPLMKDPTGASRMMGMQNFGE